MPETVTLDSTLSAADAVRALEALADPDRAAHAQRFFRTEPGGYGEGDRFLGLTVPQVRTTAKPFRALPLKELRTLLRSPWHEARLLALVVLVERFRRADEAERAALQKLYLVEKRHVNNWDLVDVSAEHILGPLLAAGQSDLFDTLLASARVWERRLAVLAGFHTIRQGNTAPTLAMAEFLLADRHDLIHKAVGWMLREAWKRTPEPVEAFLRKHQRAMPRTMLRYAIEKLPPARRRAFLDGTA